MYTVAHYFIPILSLVAVIEGMIGTSYAFISIK